MLPRSVQSINASFNLFRLALSMAVAREQHPWLGQSILMNVVPRSHPQGCALAVPSGGTNTAFQEGLSNSHA